MLMYGGLLNLGVNSKLTLLKFTFNTENFMWVVLVCFQWFWRNSLF